MSVAVQRVTEITVSIAFVKARGDNLWNAKLVICGPSLCNSTIATAMLNAPQDKGSQKYKRITVNLCRNSTNTYIAGIYTRGRQMRAGNVEPFWERKLLTLANEIMPLLWHGGQPLFSTGFAFSGYDRCVRSSL